MTIARRERPCNFCRRWFAGRQSVRAHLRHCPQYRMLGRPSQEKRKVERFVCATCYGVLGPARTVELGFDEMRAASVAGCAVCGGQNFLGLGYRLV